jgi:hypothetical protein
MKQISPLKTLIAAMFALASATAGAETIGNTGGTPGSPLSSGMIASSGSYTFTQSIDFSSLSLPYFQLASFQVFGTSTQPVTAEFSLTDGLYSYALAPLSNDPLATSWSFSGLTQPITAGIYDATITFWLTSYDVATNVTLDTIAVGQAYSLKYTASYTVTAVPEPESYAMHLAGLGLMGAIARRRSRKA